MITTGSIPDLILLIISNIVWYIAATDPNPVTDADHAPSEAGHMAFVVKRKAQIQFMFGFITLFDLIFHPSASYSPSSPYIAVCGTGGSTNPTLLPAIRLLGYVLLLLGGAFRIWAMKTLGRLFTFTLSIRPSHTLIQSGPYAFVRHPAYAGIYALTCGLYMLLATGNIAQRGFGSTVCGPWFFVSVVVLPVGLTHARLFATRVNGEEKMLLMEFGRQWEEYVKKVPYRLIPGIL